MTNRIETRIERLGHQGDGIAPGPLFAPRTLPGEVISGVPSGQNLSDVRIVTPSSDRVQSVCRHYRACGGCQLQHASDGFVAGWKQEFSRSALAAHGIETDWKAMHISPPQSRRRATFSVRRTKRGALAGFHARASDVITEIPECQLLHPDLMAALPIAEALALVGASRKATLGVTVTLSANGLDMAVKDGKPLDGPLQMVLAQFAETHDIARLSWEDEVIAARRPPMQTFGSSDVLPPPGAFLQATSAGEAALLASVEEIVGAGRRVVDLFAGCGTFALPLAQTAEVLAVEGSTAMTKALDHGWRHSTGLKKVRTEARDLFRRPLLQDELNQFDAAVIDPPRAGAPDQIAELAASQIRKIAHVSCNPVTFARDAQTLIEAGFRLDWVRVVDQFRWSVHTELVGCFTKT